MKSVALFLCVLAATSAFAHGRKVLSTAECPNYSGPTVLEKDVQFEVVYLRPTPSEEQTTKYQDILDNPMGTLFGVAHVHLSKPLTAAVDIGYFKVTAAPGDVIGFELSADSCMIILDFLVHGSCSDECLPGGACVELDDEKLQKEGYFLPHRRGCKALDVHERPRCIDASVMSMGMGMGDNGMAYTDCTDAHLMIIFNTPFFSYIDFKPEDFSITGPPGTYIESVESALHTDMNTAYTLNIVHGDLTGDDTEVKICFVGADTIRRTGTPYDSTKVRCASYMKSKKAPGYLMPSIELVASNTVNRFCRMTPRDHSSN